MKKLFSLLFIVSVSSVDTNENAVQTCELLEKTRCVSIVSAD